MFVCVLVLSVCLYVIDVMCYYMGGLLLWVEIEEVLG